MKLHPDLKLRILTHSVKLGILIIECWPDTFEKKIQQYGRVHNFGFFPDVFLFKLNPKESWDKVLDILLWSKINNGTDN